MIKYYCDSCDSEVPGSQSGRLKGRVKIPGRTGIVELQVMQGYENINNGIVCRNCLREALNILFVLEEINGTRSEV